MEVQFEDGSKGELIDETPDDRYARVELADGRVLRVERALIQRRSDGLFLPMTANDPAGDDANPVKKEEVVVPVLAEELQVRPEKHEVGSVRIHKTVQEHQELVDHPLLKERVEVKRVAINQVIDGPLPVRQMGDTMIIPLVEEVLKIEKQLVLREEIHVTRIRSEERFQEPVTVRREDAHVERTGERGQAVDFDEPARVDSAPQGDRGRSVVEGPVTRALKREEAEAERKPVRTVGGSTPIRKNKLIK